MVKVRRHVRNNAAVSVSAAACTALLTALALALAMTTAWTPAAAFLPGSRWSVATPLSISDSAPTSSHSRSACPLCSHHPSSQTAETTPSHAQPRSARRRKSKKKQKKTAVTALTSLTPSGRALSQQELAHHVAHQYLHGTCGLLRDRDLRTDKLLQQNHHHYLQTLNRRPSLVLNADYQPLSHLPLSLWHWQDSIKSVFSGKVTVVDVYPDICVRAANLEIPLPSVIALNDYVPKSLRNQRPAFTKRNVFLRDEYRCQYCNDMFHTRDLSLDHVVPRSRGGNLSWENAVTSCRKCNGRKGSLDVKELQRVGMTLLREPFVPSQYHLAAVAGRMLPRRVHPTWRPYLGMQAEPEHGRRRTKGGEGEMYIESDTM